MVRLRKVIFCKSGLRVLRNPDLSNDALNRLRIFGAIQVGCQLRTSFGEGATPPG
jgi:hypothetical protein